MVSNPVVSHLKAEEKKISAALEKSINTALAAKDLQKKVDAATNQCSKTPPKPVLTLYQKVLATHEKTVTKTHTGLCLTITPKYVMKGDQWKATATVSASFPLEKRGGGTHEVVPGDTLWAIAKTYYGSGFYWPVIEQANPDQVTSKGNFILAGTKLKLPKIDVVAASACQPAVVEKSKTPSKSAAKTARPVALPIVEVDLEKASSVQTVVKQPGMTLIYTMTLKGKLKAQRPGIVQASFNLRTYEAEISNAAKPFATSFVIKANTIDSISVSNKVSGTNWSAKLSFSKDGAAKLTMSNKFVKFKCKGVQFEGTIAMEMSVRAIPDPLPKPVPVGERVYQWFSENQRVVGYSLLVAAGAIVVVTVAEDIVTLGAGIADDPVSFAVATGMAQRALVMIK